MTKVATVRKPNLHLYLPWLRKQPTEKGFVLNCVASEWKLPEYNGLQDKHLVYFYANSKIKSNLIKTGAIDPTLDPTLDKRKQTTAPKRLSTNIKLPPISNEKDTTAQRIVAPYRNKKDQQKMAKLSKYHSTPEKKVTAVINAMTPPKRVQKAVVNDKTGNGVRKIHPLSKEQLEQVFAKYQIKTVQSNPNFSTDASNAGEERSISDNGRKSEPSPNKDNILISVAKIEPNDEIFDFNIEKADEVKVEQPEIREKDEQEGEMVKEAEEVGMEEAKPEGKIEAEEEPKAEIEIEAEVEVEQKQVELEAKPVDDVVENDDSRDNKQEEYSFEEVY